MAKRAVRDKSLKPLKPQERRFAHEYIVDHNAKQAGLRAGYKSPAAGGRLLKDPRVRDLIDLLEEEACASIDLTTHWVLHRLMKEAKRTDEKSSHSARVAALTQLGKHLKMFTDQVDLQANVKSDGAVVLYLPDNGRNKAKDDGDE